MVLPGGHRAIQFLHIFTLLIQLLTKCRQGTVEIVGSVINSAVNVLTPFEDAKVYAVSDEYLIL